MSGGRHCTICDHDACREIDRALIDGESFRNVSKRWGVSAAAAFRHRSEHLADQMAKATREQEAAERDHGEDLLAQLRALRSKAMAILLAAEASGDLKTALAGIAQARACLELLLEVEQRIDRRPQLNIWLSPEWRAIEVALLEALAAFPDARFAVADRLATLQPVSSA